MIAPLALLLGSLSLAPADLFVDAAASCANADGTSTAPYCTINEAITAAAPGDVIRVSAGVYDETLVLEKDLTVRGEDGAPFTLRPAVFLSRAISVRSGANVTVENVEVTGYRQNSAQGVIENFSGDSLVLRNASVTGNGTPSFPYGETGVIRRRFGAGSLLIYDSVVSDNNVRNRTIQILTGAPGSRAGIYGSVLEAGVAYYGGSLVVGSEFVIDNCTLRADGFARAVLAGEGVVLRNSTIQSSGWGIDAFNYDPFLPRSLAEGCTIYGGSGGVRNYSMTPFRLQNSIVSATGVVGVEGVFTSDGNNIIRSAAPGSGFVDGVNGDIVGTTAAPIDPRLGPLTAFANGQEAFPLLLDSPAVDAGGSTNFIPVDQRGRQRLAAGVDIGAYELDLDVGLDFCVQPVTSAGTFAKVHATGAFAASRDAVRLTSTGLPPNVTAIFFMSKTLGSQPSPIGSTGVCLGGQLGRLVGPGQILTSDPSGRIDLRIDTGAIPQAFGSAAAQAGATWFFQGWHRDVSQGMASFGFTAAAGITFR